MNRIILTLALLLAAAAAARAFDGPVAMTQAGIEEAAVGRVTADARPLIEDAKTQPAEAKAHHDDARNDDGDALRTATVAAALAEAAIVRSAP
jgi:hypothetical protein